MRLPLVVVLVLNLISGSVQWYLQTTTRSSHTSQQFQSTGNEEFDVTVLESSGWHAEVQLGILASIRKLPFRSVKIYWKNPSYEAADLVLHVLGVNVTGKWLTEHQMFSNLKKVEKSLNQLVILTTCGMDWNLYKDNPYAFPFLEPNFKPTFHILCIIHSSGQWDISVDWEAVLHRDLMEPRSQLRKLLATKQLTFATLSPHVTREFQSTMLNMNLTAPTIEIYPVFDLQSDTRIVNPIAVIQGNLQSFRRNYTGLFTELRSYLNSPHGKVINVTIELVGSNCHENIEIPTDLRSNIKIIPDLSYPAYFERIGRAMAILPCFADSSYTRTKASSSMGAALICGVPLLANSSILKAYAFLDTSTVWKQESHETEFGALFRVMSDDLLQQNLETKRIAIAKLRSKLLVINLRKIQSIVEKFNSGIEN